MLTLGVGDGREKPNDANEAWDHYGKQAAGTTEGHTATSHETLSLKIRSTATKLF